MALDEKNTDINYIFGRLFAHLEKWDEAMSNGDTSQLIVESYRESFVNSPADTYMKLHLKLNNKSLKTKKGRYYCENISSLILLSTGSDFEDNNPLSPLYIKGEIDQLEAFNNPGYMIKVIREQQNLLQGDLAEMIGKKQGDISRWETGEVKPRREVIIKIAEALHVDPDEITGG